MSLIRGRVIRAAAKLALFYTALVGLEIVALITAFGRGGISLRDIAEISPWLSIPFAGAFLLLAIARRWGFIALWSILAVFWAGLMTGAEIYSWPLEFTRAFVPWSVFALPLWVIGHAGIPTPSSIRLRIGPVRFSSSTALLVCWVALLAGVISVMPLTPEVPSYRTLRVLSLLGTISGVAPVLLSAYAIRHVWRGTATPAIASEPAALG